MEKRENKNINPAGGEHHFESNLGWILKALYRPVEPRSEFRNDLLSRLKEKQAEKARELRRRSRIRYIAFSSVSAMAASVALIIAVGSMSGELTTQPSNSINEAIATNQNTNLTPVAVVSEKVPAPASLASSNRLGQVEGSVQVRSADNSWHNVSQVAFNSEPVELRAKSDQAGVELAPGVRVVMEKGSSVKLQDGKLFLQNGLLSLRLLENAAPLDVQLDSHVIHVQPDSWLGMEVKDPSTYAEGGRPAPDVTMMSGKAYLANADDNDSAKELLAGNTYRLFSYPNMSNLPGLKLKDMELESNQNWIKPTLVNFQIRER